MIGRTIKDVYGKFSNDIGIDLGTANTLVYLRGHGIIINEPSVVAFNTKTNQIVAVGREARNMLGRTPAHISAVRPLVDGVISDFEVAEEMLRYFINKAEKMSKKMFRPRVVIGVPSGITNVESRAVHDAARQAGAREVYIIEEPMAAALGVRLPVNDPTGSMIIDIGGGTTDIALISMGGIVQSKNLKIAGDKLNRDIITYVRDTHKLLIGERTAEEIKIKLGTVEESEVLEGVVRGRDLVTGLPREVTLTDLDIKKAIASSLHVFIDGVRELLETAPPEVLSDVMHRGIILTGGGALIDGLANILEKMLKLPVTVAEDPLSAVARGTGIILENIDLYKSVCIAIDDDVSPR